MKLDSITITGLKGQSGRHDLAGVDIVAGPNGSGKTTRLMAVTATLRAGGRFPFLPEDCRDLVQVALGFRNGAGPVQVTRTLSPAHSAAVIPGPTGIKAVDGWIAEHIGDVRPGISDLLTVSPSERQRRLLGLVRSLPEGVPQTRAEVEEALGALVLELLRAGDPRSKKDEERPVAVPEAWGGQNVADVCDWLGRAESRLRSAKSLRERDIKSVERALADLAGQDGADEVEGTLDEAKARVERLQGELAAARGRADALKALGGSASDALVRAQEHEATVERLRAEVQALPSEADVASPFDARLAELRATLPDVERLGQAVRVAEDEVARLNREGDRLRDQAKRAERALADARVLAQAYVEGAECTGCGRTLDETCKGHEAAARTVADAEARLAEAHDRVRAWAEHLNVAGGVREQAAAALREAEVQATPVRVAIGDVERERAAALESRRESRAKLVAEGQAAKAAAEEARRHLAKLPPGVDPDLVAAEVEALEVELGEATRAVERQQRSRAREEERARWLRQRTEHQEVLAAIKTALELLTTWRSDTVASAAERLAETANEVARSVFPHLAFCAVGTDKGTELRLRRASGIEVPLEAWADSELLTFGVAAQVALLEAEGAKWKVVLVDEVQRLDPEHFRGFVVAMARLVREGRLDNVLLAGALTEAHLRGGSLPAEMAPLVRAHRLEAPAEAREAA